MIPRLNTKDRIEFLQGPLLGLRKAEIRKRPAEEIPEGVEAKCAGGREGCFESGPGEGEVGVSVLLV